MKIAEPTTQMVTQIIVEEMMQWNPAHTEAQRRDALFALSDRLIRYFGVFYAQPLPDPILPGLPGGRPLK